MILPSPILPTLPSALLLSCSELVRFGVRQNWCWLSPSRCQVSLPVRKSQSPSNRFRRLVRTLPFSHLVARPIPFVSSLPMRLFLAVYCCAAAHILPPSPTNDEAELPVYGPLLRWPFFWHFCHPGPQFLNHGA